MRSVPSPSAWTNPLAPPARFDRDRDGLVPSGGAALVVESYESAVARGADILCEIVGYGFSGNGSSGISQASDEGSFVAMQRALSDAELRPTDIDYVNARRTSTPQGDTFEARALRRLFEGTDTWISSTKSMTGHECWMAGASEIVYSLLMMRGGFVAPNINLEHPDEEVTHLRMARRPKRPMCARC